MGDGDFFSNGSDGNNSSLNTGFAPKPEGTEGTINGANEAGINGQQGGLSNTVFADREGYGLEQTQEQKQDQLFGIEAVDFEAIKQRIIFEHNVHQEIKDGHGNSFKTGEISDRNISDIIYTLVAGEMRFRAEITNDDGLHFTEYYRYDEEKGDFEFVGGIYDEEHQFFTEKYQDEEKRKEFTDSLEDENNPSLKKLKEYLKEQGVEDEDIKDVTKQSEKEDDVEKLKKEFNERMIALYKSKGVSFDPNLPISYNMYGRPVTLVRDNAQLGIDQPTTAIATKYGLVLVDAQGKFAIDKTMRSRGYFNGVFFYANEQGYGFAIQPNLRERDAVRAVMAKNENTPQYNDLVPTRAIREGDNEVSIADQEVKRVSSELNRMNAFFAFRSKAQNKGKTPLREEAVRNLYMAFYDNYIIQSRDGVKKCVAFLLAKYYDVELRAKDIAKMEGGEQAAKEEAEEENKENTLEKQDNGEATNNGSNSNTPNKDNEDKIFKDFLAQHEHGYRRPY